MTKTDKDAAAIVAFWRQAGPEKWFVKDAAFDADFRERFLESHFAAARREHDGWLDTADGALALMILLDQFPRNCFRGTGHMFATDPLARHCADRAIAAGHDQKVDAQIRVFFYLPFEHSEAMEDQRRCVALHEPLGAPYLKYALEHRDIIERFGRFPHRNKALGRETTDAEKAFLEAGGFAG